MPELLITPRQALEELARRKLREVKAEQAPAWFHEYQREAWSCNAMEAVCLAGSQGGKTAIQAYWLLRELKRCFEFIKSQGSGVALYVGPTLELLRKQAIPAFRRLFESELNLGKFTENPGKFVFSDEGLIRVFGTAEFPVSVHFVYANDSSNLESVTACCAVWDEAGQKENKRESHEALNRRLNVARSAGFGRALYGTTPYEWGWFKNFCDSLPDGAVITFPTWANPKIDRAVIEAEKERMPLWRWEMMYLGRFTRPAGQVFDCFDDQHNVYVGTVPQKWPRMLGIDFGLVNMAGVSLAQEMSEDGPTGRYYLHARYKEAGPDMRHHAQGLIMAAGAFPQYAQGGSHQESGWRQSLQLGGLHCGEPVERSVEVQIARLYAAVKARRLLIHKDLRDVLDEVYTFSYVLDEAGQPTDKLDGEQKYHYIAALRYIADYVFRDIQVGLIGSRLGVTAGSLEAGKGFKIFRRGGT